jgi:hypothetical protein
MLKSRALKVTAALVFLILSAASECYAGMTVYTLRDVYRLRFQSLSFFLFLLFACAFLFQITWNYAAKGFRSIPRLNYWRALSLSFLLGLAMLLILTMISGIREVLTPGAWRKQGASYRLNDPAQEPIRRRSIEHLRAALFDYARSHDGKFPPHDFVPEIPEKVWESPDENGSRYIYRGGLTTNDTNVLLAVEPANFGEKRFAIVSTGEVRFLDPAEVEKELQVGKK